jgi:hypothetical protein
VYALGYWLLCTGDRVRVCGVSPTYDKATSLYLGSTPLLFEVDLSFLLICWRLRQLLEFRSVWSLLLMPHGVNKPIVDFLYVVRHLIVSL